MRLLLVGAHVDYEVVTSWASVPQVYPNQAGPAQTFMLADRWVGYGAHAGVLFW